MFYFDVLMRRAANRRLGFFAVISALMAMSLFFGKAEAANSLRIDSLSAGAGDTVAVGLRLVNGIQVRGVQFTLAPSVKGVLEYLGTSKEGPARASVWTSAPLWRNDSLITLLYSGGALFEPGDTILLSVSFRIKDNSYTQKIGLNLSRVKVIGDDLIQIPDFTIIHGTLNVVGLEPLPGDANADGKSDIFDLLDVLGVLSGKKQSQFADVNRDGRVNIFDVLALLKIISNRS